MSHKTSTASTSKTASATGNSKRWLYPSDYSIARGLDRLMLYEFGLLEEHRAFIAGHFDSRIAKYEARFQKQMEAIDDEYEQAQLADAMLDERYSLIEEMPKLQWQAQFMVVYATFERLINQLCEIVRRRSELPIAVSDLQGQGIVRASQYLQKMVGVKTPFKSPGWTKAQQLGRLRNAIAHSGGQIRRDDKQSIAAATQLKAVSKSGFESDVYIDVAISPDLVASAIVTLREVISDIANYELYKPNT